MEQEGNRMNREAERKRLVELLKDAERKYLCNGTNIPQMAEFIADHLLYNSIFAPPCKIGAEVFYVHEICDEHIDISKGEVVSFILQKEGLVVYCRYEDGLEYQHLVEEFGIELFLTREDALKALEESCEA